MSSRGCRTLRRQRDRGRRPAVDRRNRRRGRPKPARASCSTSGRGKGDAMRLAIPHIRTAGHGVPRRRRLARSRDIPRLVEPILRRHRRPRVRVAAERRVERAARRLRRILPADGQLVHHRVHQLALRRAVSATARTAFGRSGPSVLRQLDLRANSTTIEQEMIIKTLGLGYRMAEVPSHEYRRVAGTSHISVWRVALALRAQPRSVSVSDPVSEVGHGREAAVARLARAGAPLRRRV